MTTKPARNVRLDPMTAREFGPWRAKVAASYAMAQVQEGHWPVDTAQQQGWDVVEGLLPAGPETFGQYLWIARDSVGGQNVGALWMAVRSPGLATEAFIYDIHVEEDLQGDGYGRAIMQAAAAAARALGAGMVALNVHGTNDRAYQLYKSLGYAVTNRYMQLGL